MNNDLLFLGGFPTCCHRFHFFVDSQCNVLGVESHAMIAEQIDLPKSEAFNKASPAVSASPDASQAFDAAISIDVDLIAPVAVAEP